MMKSPTSLIRIRYAVGVMLALSAIFAVVISTISLPSDDAQAQVTLTETETKARDWWNSHTPEERVNVLLGSDADADPATVGRQLGNPDRTDTDTTTLIPIEIAQGDYAKQIEFEANADVDGFKLVIDALIDGDASVDVPSTPTNQVASNVNDIVAVGDFLPGSQPVTGFQSAEVWWNNLICAKARIAVGEGSNTLDQTFDGDFDSTTPEVLEPSGFCAFDEGTTPTGAATFASIIRYDHLRSVSQRGEEMSPKERVNSVAKTLIGQDIANDAVVAEHAQDWWDRLLDADGRIRALYGPVTSPGPPTTFQENGNDVLFVGFDRASMLTYSALNPEARLDPTTFEVSTEANALPWHSGAKLVVADIRNMVNDRFQWIYHDGGRNEMRIEERIHWWDSLDCTQRLIALGLDNEPDTNNAFCNDWDDLDDDDPNNPSNNRKSSVYGSATFILELPFLPIAPEWWATLTEDQRINVIFGDPAMRASYDDPNNAGTNITAVTQADRDLFKGTYLEVISNSVPFEGYLPAATQALLTRQSESATVCGEPNDEQGNPDPNCLVDHIRVSSIIYAIAGEIFDPPTLATSDYGGLAADGTGTRDTITDDNEFNWPYNADNLQASVGDWWTALDCRLRRIAVGQDNDYLDPAVVADANANPPVVAKDAETSGRRVLRSLPGFLDMIPMGWSEPISVAAQARDRRWSVRPSSAS